ncbi:transmembrane protein 62-like [Eurytemora carolleeae]|uniref:transmembrane protein 62-like n=1 Tax=Eurytemora carolleeae TaxID=1294199 RepID=UPI000C79213B|nr:transmembrane protein 62-like [Eurytemora carolleeae]|eukprot:XP_023338956.1 transmembrane protein 62-like [Eurytemora affinis]
MHTMYSLHGGDNLELELVDWKSNRGYRLLAVDQGFISFTDLRFNQWPVVLPTIPKNSEFLLDSKELSLNPEMFNSVRVLVFSDARIKTVLTQINEETPSQAQQVEDGPLYSSKWNPENYKTGLHRLTVTVTDARNRTEVVQHSFTLDKTETRRFSRFFSNLVLNSSFSTLFQVLFVLSALGAVTSLPLVRLISNLFIQRRLPSLLSKLVTSLIKSCLFRKLLYVSSSRLCFYFFTLYPVYLAVGPWVVGSIIESEYGAIFAWGALVEDKFVPAQVGFLYYFLQFLIIHPGAVLACGHIIDSRNRLADSRCWFGFQHCSVFSILLVAGALSILFSISFWLQFGPLGFFVGPLCTWSYPLYGLMIFLSFRVEVPSKYSGLYLTDPGKKTDDICLEEEEEDEEGHLRRDP